MGLRAETPDAPAAPLEGGAGTLPQTDTSVGRGAFQSGELEQQIAPTRWDQWVSTIKEQGYNSLGGSILDPNIEGTATRMFEQHAMEDEFDRANKAKISPEEANARYPKMATPFDKPVYPEVADLMASDQQRREHLAAWGARGKARGSVFNLSAGLAAGLADPANLALSVVTGGVSKALGVASSLRNVFLQNLAGNTVMAVPSYIQKKAERQQVSVPDEALGVVEGAAAATGLHYATEGVAQALSFGLKKAGIFTQGMSDASREAALRAAVAQHELGAKTDVAPVVNEQQLRMAGATQPGSGAPAYQFNPELEHPSQSTFYSAKDAQTGEAIKFQDYGPGHSAVDNGQVANNLASSPESPYTGEVSQIKIAPETSFLDLEQPLDSPEGKAVVAELEKRHGVQIDLPEGATLKDLVHEISASEELGSKLDPIRKIVAGLNDPGGRRLDVMKEEFSRLTARQSELTAQTAASEQEVASSRARLAEISTEIKKPDLALAQQRELGIEELKLKDRVAELEKNLAAPREELANVAQGLKDNSVYAKDLASRQMALSDVSDVAKTMGFDGYRYVDSESGTPHHGVLLFDQPETEAVYTANKESTPRMTPDERAQQATDISEKASRESFDQEVGKQVKQYKMHPAVETRPEKFDPVVADQITQAKAKLARLAEKDPVIAEQMKKIQRESATDKQAAQVLEDFANCLMDEIV